MIAYCYICGKKGKEIHLSQYDWFHHNCDICPSIFNTDSVVTTIVHDYVEYVHFILNNDKYFCYDPEINHIRFHIITNETHLVYAKINRSLILPQLLDVKNLFNINKYIVLI